MERFKLQILIFLFVIPIFFSCKPEPAPPTTEKEIISEISREWSCREEGDDIPLSFNATISADPTDETKILVANFHKMGYTDKLSAIINTDLSIVIPQQTIGNQIFKGSGDISNDLTEIIWNYTIEFDGGTVSITATYTYGVIS